MVKKRGLVLVCAVVSVVAVSCVSVRIFKRKQERGEREWLARIAAYQRGKSDEDQDVNAEKIMSLIGFVRQKRQVY